MSTSPIDSEALQRIARILVAVEPNRDALAQAWDDVIRLRRIAQIPKWISKWFERNDTTLNYRLADITLELRAILLESGSLSPQ